MRDIQEEQINGPFEVQLSLVSAGEDYWLLTVTDKASRIAVLQLQLTDTQFSGMIGHRLQPDVQGYLIRSQLHGLVHENRRHAFTYFTSESWAQFIVRVRKEAAEIYQDWVLDAYDLKSYNGHRHKNGQYTMTLRRWVKPQTKATESKP